MDDNNTDSAAPRYRWPWFVLAAVVLGVLLAVVWMTIEVRRIRQQQSSNPWSAPRPTESSPAK